MQKADPLIRTKLRLPFIRPGFVSRPRLQARIAEGLRGPLTLIIAPAGFGKTTLVAAGVTDCQMPVGWLSLDKNDNQAGRFLSYLVVALQEADPTIGSEAAQLMESTQQAPPEAILTSLINDLDTSGREIALVLDDYQSISSQAVHEAVAFLLEHCPNTFHLVIATRSDPPLPLARLRARGQAVELRAADLRFTEPEAAQFLNEVMGLRLEAGSVAVLEERTEGWVAGLQMAALSMRDREDVLGFIEGFSGTNRYILDYLLEEVLGSQPPEIQRFLLYTSILERLTAPLCDVITEIREWSVESRNESRPNSVGDLSSLDSQFILEYLERANLFLVTLDDERQWYRYHHLFADLLRTRLDQLYPGLAPQLHARAAAWLECEGMTVDAVNHALAAGAHDHAARMVEENTARLLAQGELNALMSWIEALPAELRLTRPWLCIHQAYALTFADGQTKVEQVLTQAEARLGAVFDKAEARAVQGAIAAIRAHNFVIMGQDAEALIQAQRARELLPAEDLFDLSLAAWATGKTMLTQGRLSEARLAFEEHIRLGRALGDIWTLLSGLTYRAQVLRAQGQLHQARAVLEEALAEANQQGARSRGFIAWVEDSLAGVLYEQNELEAAARLLTEAIVLTRLWPDPNHMIYAYALQARVLLAQGDLQEARKAIGEADQVRRRSQLTRWLRRTVEADIIRVRLALQTAGQSLSPSNPLKEQFNALLASWRSELAGLVESQDTFIDECVEIAVLTLARVSLVEGKVVETLASLAPITQNARAAGHVDAAISSLVLTALALQSRPPEWMPIPGQPISALEALEEALTLARPGGYVRVFLDEGQRIRVLLTQWLTNASAGPLQDYAIHLLSQFDAEPFMVKAEQKKASPVGDPFDKLRAGSSASSGQAPSTSSGQAPSTSSGQALVEPLSQRELEVLHLIALGRTNLEIAGQLIVSRGTVKAHTASIYRKLDVANRTEAVARARQLGILP